MKVIKTFLRIIVFLVLAFLSSYTVFCTIIPAAKCGLGFIDIVKEIAISIWQGIKFLIGV